VERNITESDRLENGRIDDGAVRNGRSVYARPSSQATLGGRLSTPRPLLKLADERRQINGPESAHGRFPPALGAQPLHTRVLVRFNGCFKACVANTLCEIV
jgi:hypothetical protein